MSIWWRVVFLCLLPLVLFACETPPETVETEPGEPVSVPAALEEPVEPPPPAAIVEEPAAVEEVFEPSKISEEVYQTTKADIQHLVENLNRIIRAKNFDAWVGYLSDECLAEKSSSAFLESVSRGPRLRNQKPLTDVWDYFLRVVVLSRDHDRVDDIEFINQNRVKAYTVNARGERLRLYDLENTKDGWKIVD